MRRIVLVLWFFFDSLLILGQPISGLTGVRDTSFSLYTTYVKTKAKYPDIRIAAPAISPTVRTALNVVYAQPNGRSLHLDAFYPAKSSRKRHPAVHDPKAAVRWLRANADVYAIETTKIAALGCSAGGQLAALLGTTRGIAALEGSAGSNPSKSSRVQAVVDIDGILAFIPSESGEGDDSRSTSAATYWFGGPNNVILPFLPSVRTRQLVQRPDVVRIERGYERNRPSLLELDGPVRSDGPYYLRIGGQVQFVATGEWRLEQA